MLHARANGSLLNFIPLLRQTGTITLPSSGTARGCQGSIGSLGFFHLLLSLVVTARSTPPSTLAMSPRWRGPSSWSPISPCSVVPLLGCVRPWVFSPIHLLRCKACKVSPRGTLSYTPPALEGIPSWDSLRYTSCTGRYRLPSSASPMDASLAAVNR